MRPPQLRIRLLASLGRVFTQFFQKPDIFHRGGVLAKASGNQRSSLGRQFNPAHPSVVRVILARNEPSFNQPIDSHADGSRSEPDLWANRIHRERAFMQERFQDAEIGVAQLRPLDALLRVREQRLKGFHQNEPDMNAGGVLACGHSFPLHSNIILTQIVLMSIYCVSNKLTNMKIITVIARFLLGFIFLVFGLNGFIHFIPSSPPSGTAGQFVGALFVSHYLVPIFLLQIISAVLLLVNRYVPLALTLLGPIIVNILLIHILMLPSGLPLALVVTVLWIVVFLSVRSAFAGLFQQHVAAEELR